MNKRMVEYEDEPGLLAQLLRSAATADPQAPATSEAERRLTYGELAREVDRYARALLAQGLRRGDRLAMLTAPSVDFWIAFHAATSIGVTWLGINPRYQARDFGHVLDDAEPTLAAVMSPFDGRDYCAELAAISPELRMVCHGEPTAGAMSLEAFLASGTAVDDAGLSAARAAVAPEDIALIVYTSGTTGKPKGAMLSQATITASALANLAWMGADGLRSSVCAAPVNHVGAINNLCMPVLAAGGHIIFHPRVDVAAIGEISRRERPTYLVSSPTGFAMMLQQPQGMAERLGATRLIVFGGAVTPEPVLEQFARPGLRLANVYGQTETCGIITRTAADASLRVMSETIGEVLPGAELRVADPATNASTPIGELGEIQVRGPYLMSGYFRNPEATAAAFTADGFLRTGDLGVLREDGNVVFGGRLKEMFKSGGYNVYPVEVEQAICEHPAAAIAAVVAAPHPTFQEVGHAFVELAAGADVSADDLRAFLKSRIANYKIPKTFTLAAELPRLPNGKVDKMALKAEALAAG
ncbi:MAG: acyl--CoA ligase [Phenylobacterium sp.]|uniref:class I adenylate-forming enzyme family protein n=1 Tax=Phenylobacterium sp. TaxID=1871053 RepID=UPI001A52B883|nr:class I adenylate-forming enzyme family protein [Phenylobacterium sp.]MBL8553748.1 acyl--CoA ligase [Phenylobacterium sp.]